MSDSLFARLSAGDPRRGLYLYEDFADTPVFLSYAEMPARIAGCAEHFRRQGVRPGERILFPFETSEAVIASFLGLLELGALPFSVKPYILSTPKQAYRDFLARISERHGAGRILDVPSLGTLELPMQRVGLPPSGARAELARLREPPLEEVAFVQFSSGSTSFPKGVPITWGNLGANLRMISARGGLNSGDRSCSWLPLYHDMGLVGGLLSCLDVACDAHIAQPMSFLMDPLGWLEFMSKCRSTHGPIPNFAIDYALKHLGSLDAEELERLDLGALRFLCLGSEPINIPNLERFAELLGPRGLRRNAIRPCYGMAEVVLMVSCVGPEGWPVVTGPNGQLAISVGPVLKEFDVRLRTEDGQLCGERELGEIELRGGSLAASYFADERPLRGKDGFYATGDLGFLQGGELFITGRVNDRFKINGQSYFSSDFEQAVERLPFIRQGRTAVIQVQGRVVVLAEAQRPSVLEQRARSQQQVCSAIQEAVGVSVNPEDVLFIRYGQIQKTSSGKLQRKALAEAYEQGRIRVATPKELRADILRMHAQRIFLGSWLKARKRGSGWFRSGREVLGTALRAGLRRFLRSRARDESRLRPRPPA